MDHASASRPGEGASAARTNLPAQTTPLIGRERELAELRALLLRPAARLVTLVGPPGTGKTRLGIEVAAALANEWRHGAWMVSLVLVRDPAFVLPTIARALGVLDTGEGPLHDRLLAFLRERQLLLLLDNFEQVAAAAPVVAELLAACPHLKVLATSRSPLKVYGEREYPVTPLTLPAGAQRADVAGLAQVPAIALFVDRAQAVRPDFTLCVDNAAVVAEICTRLDGLPLAIELAAARVKLLPPAAILARVQHRLDLLTGGAPERHARQQTLRAAIGWSYDLLGPSHQALFRRLGVFAGGATLEAAEAVCRGTDEPPSLLDALASLVDEHLVRVIEQEGGEPRFVLLETVRAYALERLASSGEEEAVSRRHAELFLTLAEEAEAQLNGPAQASWLERLEREHDNLRAALAWAVARRENGLGLRMGGALWRFWFKRGHLSEGQRWLEELLALGGEVSPLVRARALNGAGNLAGIRGDLERAEQLHQENLRVRRALGDTRAVALALNNLGNVARQQGDSARAAERHEESLSLSRQAGDKHGTARSLHNLALVARDVGQHERAAALHEESLALLRELQDEHGVALALTNLGYVAALQGHPRRARAVLEEGLALSRKLQDAWGAAHVLQYLAMVAEQEGQHGRAADLFAQSLESFRDLGVKRGISACLDGLAAVAARYGQPERAATLLGSADACLERIGAQRVPPDTTYHARAVAAARARLGEETYAVAWNAGRALTLEDAVQRALATAASIQAEAARHPTIEPLAGESRIDPLTQREREVVALIARGLTNRQIASELVISEGTAAVHVKHVLAKLGLESRSQVAVWAVQQGAVLPP